MNKDIKLTIMNLYEYVDDFYFYDYDESAEGLKRELKYLENLLEKEPIEEIKRFQRERLLDKQEYNYANEFVNILEELMESIGIEVTKDKRQLIMQDFIEFIFNIEKKYNLNKKEPTKEDKVDAFADIITFSIGAIMKLGYEPECVLAEVAKEINSRVGSIVDGKFQKDLSKKHLWYKANYERCKNEC